MSDYSFQNQLFSALEKEVPNLTQEQRQKIVGILFDFISLLENGKIEEADRLIRNNFEYLEKIL